MAGLALRGLGFLGKGLMNKWGFLATAGAGAYLDQTYNKGALTKTVAEKAADTGASVLREGLDATTSKIGEQLKEIMGGETGEFLSEHWGKLLTGGIAVGLFSMESTRSTGFMIALGLAAYMAYKHLAKDGFNFNANPAPAPSAAVALNGNPTTKRDATDLSGVSNDPNAGVIQSARLEQQQLAAGVIADKPEPTQG